MSGHGWVVTRPDGVKARCGGPGLCHLCNQEAMTTKVGDAVPAIHEPLPLALLPFEQWPTGRHLDAEIARWVLKHTVIWRPNESGPRIVEGHGKAVRPYSTDIGAAMVAVRHIRSENPGLAFILRCQPTEDWPNEMTEVPADQLWRADFGISGTDMCWVHAMAPTGALAICRALLVLVRNT